MTTKFVSTFCQIFSENQITPACELLLCVCVCVFGKEREREAKRERMNLCASIHTHLYRGQGITMADISQVVSTLILGIGLLRIVTLQICLAGGQQAPGVSAS